MADAANPLGIVMLKDQNGNETAYIPLDAISETEVERLRTEHLETNDGQQSGEAAPGIKPDTAEQQSREVIEEAVAKPLGDDEDDGPPKSPAEALG
jgi:uncharacterized protein YrzB (UPF0473 family)